MDKVSFRTEQIKRMNQAAQATREAGPKLLEALVALPAWQQAKVIATTVASPMEVPTAPLIEAALAAGKTVLLPRTMPHRQMAFLPDSGAASRIISSFGIPEPPYDEAAVVPKTAIDLIVVPGIAYSLSDHNRVGFGGGYYDRYLADYAGVTVTLAAPVMTFATPQWPVVNTDIALTHVLTI